MLVVGLKLKVSYPSCGAKVGSSRPVVGFTAAAAVCDLPSTVSKCPLRYSRFVVPSLLSDRLQICVQLFLIVTGCQFPQ